MKILMVCLGNICRSPLAEGILAKKTKNLDISVDSAGTAAYHVGELPDKRAIEIAKKYNIDLSNQRSRQFTQKDFERFDIVYAMDASNYRHLISLSKTKKERNKIKLILNEINPLSHDSVPDPYYGDGDGFQIVYDMLDKACEKIISSIE